jgi:hypothetical protein
VIFRFALAGQVAVDHLSDWCRSICAHQHILLLTTSPMTLRIGLHVPGNLICRTFLPSFSSASASIWHCVDFPARSRPSKTMSLPRVIFGMGDV